MLDRTKLGEQDLILTLLAEDGSERRAVAKGARKPGSRLAGRTELYSEADFLLAPGRTLFVVQEAALVEEWRGLRDDIVRLSAAACVAKVAQLMAMPDFEDAIAFLLCRRSLAALAQSRDIDHLRLCVAAYVMKALTSQGWRPELSLCVACGSPDIAWVSVEAGGALCDAHRDLYESQPMDERYRAWLEALLGLTFDRLLAAAIDTAMARRLYHFATSWAQTQLDSRIKAFEIFESLDVLG